MRIKPKPLPGEGTRCRKILDKFVPGVPVTIEQLKEVDVRYKTKIDILNTANDFDIRKSDKNSYVLYGRWEGSRYHNLITNTFE